MRRTSRPSGHRRPGAPATLFLLALIGSVLLFQGMVEPHDPLGEPAGLSGSTVVFEAARHPGESAHLETSAAARVPPCPACLLELQTLGAALHAPEPQGLPEAVSPAAPAAPRPAPSPFLPLSSGRAPPLA